IKMASITPAKTVGIDKTCGSISAGKATDLVICDDTLNVINTFKDGTLV
ncbi:MAG: amidohydrolase family protein, partial [Clostridia bacterium]|nr:amidohydrolase family protein [Clostridia bacterium]